MKYICTKCLGDDIEELMWVGLLYGETSSCDQFYCKDCESITEVTKTNDENEEADIGSEPTVGKLDTPKRAGPTSWSDYE